MNRSNTGWMCIGRPAFVSVLCMKCLYLHDVAFLYTFIILFFIFFIHIHIQIKFTARTHLFLVTNASETLALSSPKCLHTYVHIEAMFRPTVTLCEKCSLFINFNETQLLKQKGCLQRGLWQKNIRKMLNLSFCLMMKEAYFDTVGAVWPSVDACCCPT